VNSRQLADNRRWLDEFSGHVWTPIEPWSEVFINDTTQQERHWDALIRQFPKLRKVSLEGWS